jgi:hypothetical protein
MPAKLYHVDLSTTEVTELKSIINKHESTSEIVKRSKILLRTEKV